MRSLLALWPRWRQRTAEWMLPPEVVAGVVVLLVGAWVTDLLAWVDSQGFSASKWAGPPRSAFDLVPVASGAIAGVAAVALLVSRLGRTATAACAAVAAAIPVTASVVLWPLPKGELFGYPLAVSELMGVLLVLAVAAYRCRPLPVAGIIAVAALALLSEWLRSSPSAPAASEALGSGPALAVGVGLTAGLYMRWRAEQRRSHVQQALQQERLAVARDLHDEVAHQITGIVVQVQALQHIADSAPDSARSTLPEIERSAAHALASMRRLVAALREPDDAPVDNRGVHAAVQGLAQPPAPGRPHVDVAVSGPVAELPTDIGAAVVRIAQESVTNALRYARGATRVVVDLTAGTETVRLEVRDNGRGDTPSLRTGGGHGLVGMAERARLLGGKTTAGPATEGTGWRVLAELPTPHTAGKRV